MGSRLWHCQNAHFRCKTEHYEIWDLGVKKHILLEPDMAGSKTTSNSLIICRNRGDFIGVDCHSLSVPLTGAMGPFYPSTWVLHFAPRISAHENTLCRVIWEPISAACEAGYEENNFWRELYLFSSKTRTEKNSYFKPTKVSAISPFSETGIDVLQLMCYNPYRGWNVQDGVQNHRTALLQVDVVGDLVFEKKF